MASANLGRVSFVPEGTYDSAKSYVRLSVVNFNTGTYVSKMDVPAGIDPGNTNYWMPLIAINSGGGGGGGGTDYVLPIADATTLGGVMPVAKTQDMTTPVGVDANGRLYATDAPAATLVVEINQSSRANYSASEIDAAFQSGKSVTLLYTGHVFQYVGLNTSKAEFVGVIVGEDGVSGITIGVNEDKTLTVSGVEYNYTLPTASESTLGGVKPVAKTSDMTQAVGVDSTGALFTVPGGGSGGSIVVYDQHIVTTEEVDKIEFNLHSMENTELILRIKTGSSTFKMKIGVYFPVIGNSRYNNYAISTAQAAQYDTHVRARLFGDVATSEERYTFVYWNNSSFGMAGPYYDGSEGNRCYLQANTGGETFPIGTVVDLYEINY